MVSFHKMLWSVACVLAIGWPGNGALAATPRKAISSSPSKVTPPPASTSAADAWPWIRQLGFMPIDAPVQGFALQDIDTKGKPVGLERFRGQWIWLVFWATWCGACNQQMPLLEALHEEFAPKGLAVIGIATDNGPPEEVKAHVTRKGINFTILHDPDGSVATAYQASAIPTMYLVSPDFRLVGFARGVLNVASAEAREALAALLPIKNVAGLDPAAAGTLGTTPTDNKVPLAQTLKPPSVKMQLNPAQPVAGEPALLEVTVTWNGDLGAYIFKVPKVTVPEGITLGEFTVKSSSRDGKASIVYRAPLQATATGEYTIGPVEMGFGPRGGAGGVQSTRGNTLQVAFGQNWLQRSWIALTAGAIAVAALIGAVAVSARRRGRRAGEAARLQERASVYARLLDEKERISRIRLQGDGTRYSLELLNFLQGLLRDHAADEGDPEWNDLNKFLEKIRYGGYELDKHQLAKCEQKVRELMDKLAPVSD